MLMKSLSACACIHRQPHEAQQHTISTHRGEQEEVIREIGVETWCEREGLPFCVNECLVSGLAVVQAESCQLRVVDEIDERLVCSWRDALIQCPILRDRVSGIVKLRPVDVRGIADIE